jgi:hypothetical protein
LIFLGFFGVFTSGELMMVGGAGGPNGWRWTVVTAWAIAL